MINGIKNIIMGLLKEDTKIVIMTARSLKNNG